MKTEWNYEPCTALRCIVIVGDTGRFPSYWARQYVGNERFAVEIKYNGSTFYIDDEDGSGWDKVTNGGGPDMPHKSLDVDKVLERLDHTW